MSQNESTMDSIRAYNAGMAYARRADSTAAGADIIMAGLATFTEHESFWTGYRLESKRLCTMESAARRVLDGNW